MLTVIIIMSLGVAIGYLFRKRERLVIFVEKFTMRAIYLLLFLLGLAIGKNELIVNNLHLLGIKALIIAMGSIAGSVLLAWVGYILWFKPKIGKHEE